MPIFALKTPYKAPRSSPHPLFPPARLESTDCGPCRDFGSRREARKAAAVKLFLDRRVSKFKSLTSFGSRLRRCPAPSHALYCVLSLSPRCRTRAGSHQPPFSIDGPLRAIHEREKCLGEFMFPFSSFPCFCFIESCIKSPFHRAPARLRQWRRRAAPVAGRRPPSLPLGSNQGR